MQKPPKDPLNEALFRYQVISQVLVLEKSGYSRSKAVKKATRHKYLAANGEPISVSRRSIYRWLENYEKLGFNALMPTPRVCSMDSVVLSQKLLDFFTEQKADDPQISIPELIRRARLLNIITLDQSVCRVTAWRTLNRIGVDTSRRKTPPHEDCRRFAYPHRMQMCLVDGKHFRAGRARLKRVAFFYLDDATRLGLGVKVGTTENAALFLQGLYEVLRRHGLMDAMFVDNGSGFIATDTIDVLRKLGILFIHGTAGYPEGHGKIERFNRTALEQVLRCLDRNPEIDPACEALELRLSHYLREQYNRTLHESLSSLSPDRRFLEDARPLSFHQNENILAQAFVLHHERRVSADNVVSLKGTAYEVIRGHAGARILLYRNLLNGQVSMVHQGRLLKLEPLDPTFNARDRRSRKALTNETDAPLPRSSAQIAFDRDYRPVVDATGGFKKEV